MFEQNRMPEFEEPNDSLKESFRTAILEATTGVQIDPSISVFIDSEGTYCATFEEIVLGDSDPRVVYHDYYLYADGKLDKHLDEELLEAKIAREMDPSPVKQGETEFDLKLTSIMAQGHSMADALKIMTDEIFALPGINTAVKILMQKMRSDAQAEALGVTAISSGELIDVMEKIKANFQS